MLLAYISRKGFYLFEISLEHTYISFGLYNVQDNVKWSYLRILDFQCIIINYKLN